jgi:hypothetical protein
MRAGDLFEMVNVKAREDQSFVCAAAFSTPDLSTLSASY